MDAKQKTIVLALVLIIVGIAALVNPEYRVYIIILFPLILIY